LGLSGLEVSSLALGTMMFGAWGNAEQAECANMVDIALDSGITTFDTADIYDQGHGEEMLGLALKGRRDGVVLATKFGNQMGDDPACSGGSRRWIMQAVEGSLRRLQTDYIDLYQMHRPDPAVDIAETLAALDELVQAGKVRAFGTSCFTAEQLVEAHSAPARGAVVVPCCEQPPYSILCRGIEPAVLPTCAEYGMGVMVWAPLNGGWLTGKYRRDQTAPPGSRANREPEHFDYAGTTSEIKFDLVAALSEIVERAGMTLPEMALGFVLAHTAVTAALIGPRTPEQLRELLAAGQTKLDAETLAAIDSLVAPGTNINPADAG
jgi:aryl-alcohol dehydrogenase-like predicted oxidoreductase